MTEGRCVASSCLHSSLGFAAINVCQKSPKKISMNGDPIFYFFPIRSGAKKRSGGTHQRGRVAEGRGGNVCIYTSQIKLCRIFRAWRTGARLSLLPRRTKPCSETTCGSRSLSSTRFSSSTMTPRGRRVGSESHATRQQEPTSRRQLRQTCE